MIVYGKKILNLSFRNLIYCPSVYTPVFILVMLDIYILNVGRTRNNWQRSMPLGESQDIHKETCALEGISGRPMLPTCHAIQFATVL